MNREHRFTSSYPGCNSRQQPHTPERANTLQNVNWRSKDPYKVQPGLCVIINNTNFKYETDLPGEKDEQNLFKLFFSLGFEVVIHRNLTAHEMVHKVEAYSKLQHTGVFFLIILSHGTMVDDKEVIIGTDGKTVTMNNIEAFFHVTKCPTLKKIPKIFLIDACRGNQRERAYLESQSHDTSRLIPRNAGQNPSNRRVAKLDTSDFLLVYPATRGHVAFSTSEGSRLTQTFIEVTEEAEEDETITNIIQEVKSRVERHGEQMVESVDRLPRDYFIKRNIRMRGTDSKELHSEFCTRVQKWIPVREETMRKIEGIIEVLKVHHRNVNVSRITGSTVSIIGTAMAIAGFGLAAVTFGASVGLTVPGIILAVTGGSTVAGASIADTVLQKLNVKKAQEQLREDYDQLHTIQVIAKIIDSNTVAASSDERKEYQEVGKNKVVGEVLGQGFIRASTVGVKVAEIAAFNTLEIGAAALRIGGTAARSIAAVGLALNVVLIPVDLVEIVRSSISLAKGSQTKAVKQLDEIVEQLKQQFRQLRSATYEQAQDGEMDQADTGSGTGPSTGTVTGPSTGTEMGPDTGTETGSSTGTDTEPGTGAVPGTETETGSGMGTETEQLLKWDKAQEHQERERDQEPKQK